MKLHAKHLYLAMGLGFAAFSGTASAISQICVSATQFGIPQCMGNAACIAQVQANHPECFGATASTAASSQSIYSTSLQQILAVSKAVGVRTVASNKRAGHKVADSGQISGLAAGDSSAQWNIWASANGDSNKYNRGNYVDAVGATRNNTYNINVTNVVLGADYQLSSTLAAGLSAGFDRSSGTGESFLTGASLGVASQSSTGYTIAPYLGWQISQDLSLDATMGLGTVKGNTDGVTGKSDRLFYGANLNYSTWMGNLQLTGKGSYLHGEEKSGNLTNAAGGLMAGTAVTNKVDQLRLEAQAGYWLNDNIMPYVGLGYANDFNRSTSALATAQVGKELGRNAFLWTLGVNLFSIQNSLTGGIAYTQESGRTYAKNNTLIGNINYRF